MIRFVQNTFYSPHLHLVRMVFKFSSRDYMFPREINRELQCFKMSQILRGMFCTRLLACVKDKYLAIVSGTYALLDKR